MKHKASSQKKAITNKLRRFAVKHPKLRYCLDKIDPIFAISLIILQAIIAVSILLLGIMLVELCLQKYDLSLGYLPFESISITGVLALALPAFTWNQSRRHEIRMRAFSKWESQAQDLVVLLCEIAIQNSVCQKQMHDNLGEFIFKNKAILYLYVSPKLWEAICSLYTELGIANSRENIDYFTQKALRILRKEMGLSKNVFLTGSHLRKLDKLEVSQ